MNRLRVYPTNTKSSLLMEIIESVRYAQLWSYIINHHPGMGHGRAGRRCPVTPDRDKYSIDSIIYTPEPSIIRRTPTAHFVSGTCRRVPREWCSAPRHIGLG